MSIQVELPLCTGVNAADSPAREWKNVTFSPPAVTSEFLITVLTVYSTMRNGMIEVEFYGNAGIIEVTISVKNRCYSLQGVI